MKIYSKCPRAKRLGASLVAGAMLMQLVAPAFATVSQLPGLYVTPPDANVMFTLDDSLSMLSEAIPDFISDTTGMPTSDSSVAIPGFGPRFPNLWGSGSEYWDKDYYKCGGNSDSQKAARFLRSSKGNPLHYNPDVTYLPWPTAGDDKLFNPNANPAAVKIHPESPLSAAATFTRDLTTRVGGGSSGSGNCNALSGENSGFWPATYFIYKGATPLPAASPNSALNVPGNFAKVEVQGSGGATYDRATTRSDCTGAFGAGNGGCTRVQELQNFANWLQYYRTRMLMAKGGVAAAFAQQQTNLRVGFGTINTAGTVRQGVQTFETTRRTSFYTDLYGIPVNPAGTPLRKAADEVGQYFQRSNIGNPWAEFPQSAAIGKEYTCRKAFHILSTDGYWNDGLAPATAPANNNNDSFSGITPPKGAAGGTTYAFSDTGSSTTDPLVGRFTISPFSDGTTTRADTLADAAAYYWRNDLRTDLNNDVFPSNADPAFWQHLTTYTVGLGISGSGGVKTGAGAAVNLSSKAERDALISNKTPVNWTDPHGAANDNNKGDDLIHASMNGRGNYFLATDPPSLRVGLSAALAEAGSNPGSLASVATESAQVSITTEVYQAVYNPAQWSGRLYAFSQSATGAVDTTPSTALWEASNKMPAPASRNIYTWNPSTKLGTPFLWGNLTATQKANLNIDPTLGNDLVNYLRGSNARELAQNGPFRDRARYTVAGVPGGVLGDIVNGSPIKGPSAGGGYERLPAGSVGQASYATYRSAGNTALDNMRNTLFVGANDGMLHAFDLTAGTTAGAERFAFVPNSVFSVPRSLTGTELKLKMLSDPAYAHRFTVDGPPQIGDAYIGNGSTEWRTVLLSSTGAGARSVFAMDITNPAVVSGGFDQTKLLWEFSEADPTDGSSMGYVINYPHIARTRSKADGTGARWVAIFGNGYDSVDGRATLFVRDLITGQHVWKMSVGAAGGNGLSQPNFTVNNNRELTAVYAGDLKGNLWKFDLDDPEPANWKVSFGSAPNYSPLYAPAAADVGKQPITVMPELTYHPNGGVLASFGTGKLFELEDTAAAVNPNINLNTQAIYGIWDKPSETTGFTGTTTLVAQTQASLAAAADTSLGGTTSTAIDWATKRGWYLNLSAGPSGERVNVNPQQAKSTLLVVANTPNSDPCKSGGSSRLFALDPITGGAPAFGVFDANGVNGITAADRGYNVKSIAFAVLSLPTLQSKKTFTDQITTEKATSRGQTGERLGGVENKTTTPADCTQWLLAGGSDTSIAGFDISLCNGGKPRVSWRQLK